MSVPSKEVKIWLALKARMESLSLSPSLPIAWPNEAFTKPAGGYIRVNNFPNVTRRVAILGAEPHQRLGILQLDIFAPLNENSAVAEEIAGQVAAHFEADLKLRYEEVTVRVVSAPSVTRGLADNSHWQVPVMVNWECFA